jgi:hypothetical protein
MLRDPLCEALDEVEMLRDPLCEDSDEVERWVGMLTWLAGGPARGELARGSP